MPRLRKLTLKNTLNTVSPNPSHFPNSDDKTTAMLATQLCHYLPLSIQMTINHTNNSAFALCYVAF